MLIHVVKPNETIYAIARMYGVSAQSIIFNNQLYNPSLIAVGQALLILFPEVIHTVRRGETLYSIAKEYGISLKELLRNNPFVITADHITEGELLTISYRQEKLGTIVLNGFAYPNIQQAILEETLPYLTKLSIFSYKFTKEGELIAPNDTALITAAKNFGVQPILVLASLSREEYFDSSLVHAIVNDIQAQNRLIQNLLYVLQQKGYAGVDIDFESIPSQDKEAYVNFMRNLSNALWPEGFIISIDLSPKERADQKGVLYEGLDYAGLSRYADNVLLMTYEWGYARSMPMAVAPINKVRQILDYAVTEIPRNKINLGIPNYGYQWPLPYIAGVTRARSIGNIEAAETAALYRAQIQFDEIAMTPYYLYTSTDGQSYEVWFEDVRSIDAKIRLIPEYNIMGAGYWNIMRSFRPNFMLVNALFDIA